MGLKENIKFSYLNGVLVSQESMLDNAYIRKIKVDDKKSYKFLTLDVETYKVNNIMNLLSIAIY